MKIAQVSYNCRYNDFSGTQNRKLSSNNLNLPKNNSITSFSGNIITSPITGSLFDAIAGWFFKDNVSPTKKIDFIQSPVIKNIGETCNAEDVAFIFNSKINGANLKFCKFLSECLQKYPELEKTFLFQASLPPNFIIKKSEDAYVAENNAIFKHLLKISNKKETLKISSSALYDDEAINWIGIIPRNINSKSADFIINNLYEMLCLRQRLDSRPYIKWQIWASRAKLLTDYASCEIKNGVSFDSVLNNIAQGYSCITKNNLRGIKRVENSIITPFGDNLYDEYNKRFEQFIYKPLKSSYEDMDITHILKVKEGNKEKKYMLHPNIASVEKALNYAKKHYCNLTKIIEKNNRGQKVPIDERYYASEQIAAIHYLLSNAVPYYRGSAGIGMILTNALKKSAGLPLTPVKRNTALDLEAYCNTLTEYKEKWFTFFECRPED